MSEPMSEPMSDTTSVAGSGEVGYEEAIEWEEDFLWKKEKSERLRDFHKEVFLQRGTLNQLVAFHLKIDPRRVRTYMHGLQGNFNLALPVRIYDEPQSEERPEPQLGQWPPEDGEVGEVGEDGEDEDGDHVVLRLPAPSKCGEALLPGSMQEKMRCEVAMYVWMERHCPDIRIPFLYGFGFPDGKHYIHASGASLWQQAWLYFRQIFASLCGRPVPSDYVPIRLPASIEAPLMTGYMLLEYLGPSVGTPLHLVAHPSFREPGDHEQKKRNFYRSFSRIMLSLARVPQPRIGSFRFHYDGTIALDNRPLICSMTQLESEGAPRTMDPETTYDRVDDYLDDMMTFHEQRFLTAPHAVLDEFDGKIQMGTWAFLRCAMPHLVNKAYNRGPFFLHLSHKNFCNFLVDEDWNVTGMFDLEYIVSTPVESLDLPIWLNWTSYDDVICSGYADYDAERKVFMDEFRVEEQLLIEEEGAPAAGRWSVMMDASWRSQRLWMFMAILSRNASAHIADARIKPVFGLQGLLKVSDLFRIWRVNAPDVLIRKLADNEAYLDEVAAAFGRERAVRQITVGSIEA